MKVHSRGFMASHFPVASRPLILQPVPEKERKWRSPPGQAVLLNQRVNAFSAGAPIPLHTDFASEVAVGPKLAPAFIRSMEISYVAP